MQKVPMFRKPIVKEPAYVKMWKNKPEPEPKYSPMWINWKRANFPKLSLKEILEEAKMF